MIKKIIDRLIRDKFSNFILGYNPETPEEVLFNILKEKKFTLSTAESCTGGLIAKRITDMPGASEIYKGSVIAYSNEVKVEILNVSVNTLKTFGAVSENTAAEMASGVSRLLNTDISVATTGIAGPGGGSEKKPVGTVCFAFLIKNNIHTATCFFQGGRNRIRILSSLFAINHLSNYLKEHF